jgi:hypothetical protein
MIAALTGLAQAQEPAKVPPDHAERMKKGLDLFKTKVRGILTKQCLDCHGGKKTNGGFDLSDRKLLMDSSAVGKDAKSSPLYYLITHKKEPRMPHKADKLAAGDIDAIAEWLDLGSPYDKPLIEKTATAKPKTMVVTNEDRKFWSFQPLKKAVPPQLKDEKWVRTPIDRFVLAKLVEKGLQPNPPAEPRTLIRRIYFDLIGLPPSPEEVDAFEKSALRNPQSALEELVDRLLMSPHYGERWARHWMDVARFAESHGYEQDYDRKFAYHYRDFLIKAFNADMPFDQFVRWQIAGDELAPDDPLALTATGFLGAGAFPTQLTEAEFESARYDELDDMASTTSVAFLGLTIGCARCHDHKYDPLPSRDYYRLVANFTTTIRSEIDLEIDKGAKPVKAQVSSEGFQPTKHHADDRGFPHYYPQTHFLTRGDPGQKQGVAAPGFLQVLMRNEKDEAAWQAKAPDGWKRTSFRRAGLANWLTDIDNGAGHLTARVIVNRLWQHHFGRGIVSTPSDFGFQGERPTHPELLDWLAVDLIQNGWQLKRLHKLMILSSVYLQSSQFDESRAKIDRENQYWWRWQPRRLEAEPIRDSMLAISGQLDPTMYGPGTLDPNMKRRSVYFSIKRSQLIPMMMLFDWPEHLVSIGQRASTTVAPQALAFMNGPQTRQYAERLAQRLAGQNRDEAIKKAYLLAYARSPGEREAKLSAAFIDKQASGYRNKGKPNAENQAMVDFCQALFSMNEFVYVE